ISSGKAVFTMPEEYADREFGTDFYAYLITEDLDEGSENDYASLPVTISDSIPRLPAITIEPKEKTLTYGYSENLVLSVSVGSSGAGNFKYYQWYENTEDSITGGTLISSATNAFYSIPRSLGAGKRYYYCKVSDTLNSYGNAAVSAPAVVTINPKEVTVSNIKGIGKTYDGTTTADLDCTQASVTGTIGYDSLSVTAVGEFESADAGEGKTVMIRSISLEGDSAKNYVLAENGNQETATATISKAKLAIHGITAEPKEYDGETTAVLNTKNATISGLVSGESVEFTVDGAFENAEIGENKTVSLSNWVLTSGTKNYEIDTEGCQQTATADITGIHVYISGITAKDKVYDGNKTAEINDGQAVLKKAKGDETVTELTVSGITAEFADKYAGSGKNVTIKTATLSETDLYLLSLDDTNTKLGLKADITTKPVTATVIATERDYDAENTSVVISGGSVEGVVTGDVVAVDTDDAAGTIENANAGVNKPVIVTGVKLKGVDAGNYRLASQPSDVTVTIRKIAYSGIRTAETIVPSGEASENVTVALPELPDGAVYAATGTAGGNDAELISGTPTVTDNMLAFSTTGKADHTSATVSVGVTGATNYQDYEVVVTVTARRGRIWTDEIPDQVYTGKAIKPGVTAYSKGKVLSGKDYQVSYKANTNVTDQAIVTITGKGNYTGSYKETFRILPRGIDDPDVKVSEIASKSYSRKKYYTPVPTVSYNGKKLKNKKDFTVTYYSDETCTTAVKPKDPGKYYAKVSGIKNFNGYVVIPFEIAGAGQTPVSKLTIGKIPSQKYTGSAIEPAPSVKSGKTVLTKDVHYTVTYEENIEIGTGRVIITGIEPYVGKRTVTFRITGTPIAKATVSGIPKSVMYDGTAKTPEITLSYKPDKKSDAVAILAVTKEEYDAMPEAYRAQIDCIISYENNVNTGKATVILKGVHGASGTVKKTFKITPFDASKNKGKIRITEPADAQKYLKSGAKPKVKVEFEKGNGERIELIEGTDYKLTYSDNKKLSDGTGAKAPTVTVTGKGNFKGTNDEMKCAFAIEQADLGEAATVIAKDLVFKNKAGNWKSGVTVVDAAGTKLKAGTDYEKAVKYYKVDGGTETELGQRDKLNPGDVVKVVVKACGTNYSGQAETTYRIIASGHDISKLKGSVSPKAFTEDEITITKDDIAWKSGKKAVNGVTFEIDEVTYKNNRNKGKATVVVRGTGEWGGSKKITFTIKPVSLLWK
nr:hypothetical protein [Lachnospiraceae bacterium]